MYTYRGLFFLCDLPISIIWGQLDLDHAKRFH